MPVDRHTLLPLYLSEMAPYNNSIPFFQQLTGINVIMFYAPILFNTIGFGDDASLMSAVITGVVNVGATLVSIYGVDKWGSTNVGLLSWVELSWQCFA
uniref:Uncharacterized protein n=1 Tax=Cannabis sativa TaxID=3483 RepID=A0A803Q663_CANSA